ncbi:zinc finger protein 91-like isoform X1 [Periophthalmus magnuspinnatus]|uniref:zinc finger protein 91-like isoform X1 n=1 Tax=Periophthalmus magnuspinnatus TaxID=409849 RepID=UPI00145BC3D7|nr:zinc finger protein 91-like isoform X1 [Periophthalmus magnuspinnatus]XP_055080911.1 zinc finger protein 91-like isoform X1 [Periophthalmus magnuspinnatus]
MADYLSRACRLQLTTAMENLVRTAVLEISQIFEDSLHDHQVELARKGEEIAHLKVKLQRVELKLKDMSAQSATDTSFTQIYETSPKSEEPAPEKSTDPEIDFEVTDDWCVPLDSENVVKQDIPCPSVRLKQFSIPLWPISLQHEAFLKIPKVRLRPRQNRDNKDLHEKIKPKGQSKRGRPRLHPLEKDTFKDLHEKIEPKVPSKRGRPRICPLEKDAFKDLHEKIEPKVPSKRGRPRIRPLEKDRFKDVLVNIKEEPSDYEVKPPIQTEIQKTHKRTKRRTKRRKRRNSTGQQYCCRFCPKVFDTAFGLSVHDRAHKKCKGCKKIFPFPSVLQEHKIRCKYYKALMKLSKQLPTKGGKCPSIKQVSEKCNTSVESTSRVRRIIKEFTCKKCLTKFATRSLLIKHSCNFAVCPICSKRFTSQMNLKVHTTKIHKNPTYNTLELSWTKPLDENEDNQEKDFSLTEKYIRRCSDGFKCLICKRVCATKYSATEHYYSHTGEKPYSCGVCSKTFAHRSALSHHRITTHGMHMKYLICACSKRFMYKLKYKEHTLICPTANAQKNGKKA